MSSTYSIDVELYAAKDSPVIMSLYSVNQAMCQITTRACDGSQASALGLVRRGQCFLNSESTYANAAS